MFDYHERDGVIWAEYSGGSIVLGRLTGIRVDDALDFRYVHVSDDGATSSGHCTATLVMLSDGRIRSSENWTWESRPGSGQSVVEEPRRG